MNAIDLGRFSVVASSIFKNGFNCQSVNLFKFTEILGNKIESIPKELNILTSRFNTISSVSYTLFSFREWWKTSRRGLLV